MEPLSGLKLTLMKGALWTVGTRWSIKAIGFLNTVIMARLLVPADYGVVAMSMLTVGLIQAFMDLGVSTALLRKGEVHRDEIDSAWTLRLLQSIGVCIVLLIASYQVGVYFNEPRVKVIIWVLSVCIIFEGASNIGLILAQKVFNFALEFRITIIAKALSVLATLAGGLYLGDYRALVLGIVVGYSVTFVLSYGLHPYRPRWNTTKIGELWAVTKWLMLSSIGTFVIRRSDELIAARVGTTEGYGIYHVGSDLGRLPVGELGPSLLRAFLPILSSIKSDLNRTNSAVLKALAASNSITLPIGFGVAAVALPLTALILGEKWQAAAPFVAGFAIVASAQFFSSPLNTLLVLNGHTRTQTKVVWVELIMFAIAVYFLLPSLNLIGLVWARMIAMAGSAAVTVFYAQTLCGLSWISVAMAITRPLIGSMLMYLVVSNITHAFETDVTQLVVGITGGVLLYAIWSIISWWAAGKPEGLESTFFEVVRKLKRKQD